MKAKIGITDKNLDAVCSILNVILSDEHIVYAKTRNYHWNYEGDNFMEMHKFYEGQYNELAEMIDEIAERVRMLGRFPLGRLADFIKTTRLGEDDYTTAQSEQLKNLLDDHESMIVYIRKAIDKVDETYKDAGTTDFITGIMQQHEKMAWMIRSYLK